MVIQSLYWRSKLGASSSDYPTLQKEEKRTRKRTRCSGARILVKMVIRHLQWLLHVSAPLHGGSGRGGKTQLCPTSCGNAAARERVRQRQSVAVAGAVAGIELSTSPRYVFSSGKGPDSDVRRDGDSSPLTVHKKRAETLEESSSIEKQHRVEEGGKTDAEDVGTLIQRASKVYEVFEYGSSKPWR
ncbi:unnamed protein product [Caenorhabditis auriculariae]|uniref:Uncharacterized protein n=1 Tax=Caenorhabditis auriculariae TaxID=2777116 RepID=A0A8S1HS50_9PELO|nr:unnamed protein product [Caenorhabditis auriculariae]